MKKITLLTGFAIVTGLFAFLPKVSAQITITQTDLPSVGLNVVTDSDGVTKPLPGGSGGPQNWDFSNMMRQKSKNVMFMAPSATQYASAFPSANLADSTAGGNGYNFFVTNSGLFAVEGAEEIVAYSGNNFWVQINLNPMFTQSGLPATMGATAGGDARGSQKFNKTIVIVDSERITTNISYSDTVDAYGTLKMPNGKTYNVLRQKHHEVDNDSIFTHTFLGWSLSSNTTTYKNQYDWYTNGVGYILVEMDMDQTFANVVDLVWDTTAPFPTSINEISIKNNINVYPNPANTQVTFMSSIKDIQYIAISDIAGRQLEKIAVKNGVYNLNTSSYSNGLYLYNVTDQSGNLLDRGKFTVQH